MMSNDNNTPRGVEPEVRKPMLEASQQIDDELILTNDVEGDAVESLEEEMQIEAEEAEAEDNAVVEQSFRQALSEQIHEEDAAAPRGQKIPVMKILGGEFFMSQILRRNLGIIVIIGLCIIFSISNRYSCEKSLLEIDRLKAELKDAKYKALSTSSRLTEQSRQSNVLEMLKNNKDSVLKIATQPPFIVNVPE